MKKDIVSGRHLQVFTDRQSFWEQCAALFNQYVALLEKCFKGREKYSTLQVEWMEYIRLVQYERPRKCEAAKLWAQLVEKTSLNPSETTKSAIVSSIAVCGKPSFLKWCNHTFLIIYTSSFFDRSVFG